MNDGWTGAVGGIGRYGRVRSVIAPSRLRLLSMQSNRLDKRREEAARRKHNREVRLWGFAVFL